MATKANTYRAVLIGLAIIIIAFIVYFIYKAIAGTKKVVQSSTINTSISPLGSGQSIRENSPISNQPSAIGSSTSNIVPVSPDSSSANSGSSGALGTSGASSSGTMPNGYDTANEGPANGTSPCNAFGSLENPTCQAQQVYPKQ